MAKTYTSIRRPRKSLEKRGGILFAVISGVRTMVRLTPRQRSVLVDKVPDIANIVAGAVVIGFTFGEPAISWPVVVTAVATWAGVLVFVLAVVEDRP